MKTPDKVYLEVVPHSKPKRVYEDVIKIERTLKNDIEYTRTDAFIEKACEFLKSYRQDTHDGTGYIAGIVNDKTIENFRNYMKGE